MVNTKHIVLYDGIIAMLYSISDETYRIEILYDCIPIGIYTLLVVSDEIAKELIEAVSN